MSIKRYSRLCHFENLIKNDKEEILAMLTIDNKLKELIKYSDYCSDKRFYAASWTSFREHLREATGKTGIRRASEIPRIKFISSINCTI